MSVEPGFGGQKFMPEVVSKLRDIKQTILNKKLNIDIEIDGGINFENCKIAKEAGANILVSGSTIFKENKGNLKKEYRPTQIKLINALLEKYIFLLFSHKNIPQKNL